MIHPIFFFFFFFFFFSGKVRDEKERSEKEECESARERRKETREQKNFQLFAYPLGLPGPGHRLKRHADALPSPVEDGAAGVSYLFFIYHVFEGKKNEFFFSLSGMKKKRKKNSQNSPLFTAASICTASSSDPVPECT